MGAKKKREGKRHNRRTKTRRRVALKPRVNLKEDGIFGFMVGKMKIVGDIESPIPDWSQWRPAKNLKK
jgi:hypothetical protein